MINTHFTRLAATWQGYGAVAVIDTQFEVVGLHTGFVRGAQ